MEPFPPPTPHQQAHYTQEMAQPSTVFLEQKLSHLLFFSFFYHSQIQLAHQQFLARSPKNHTPGGKQTSNMAITKVI